MTDEEFVLTTYIDNCIKLAKVNLLTGEYKFLKTVGDEVELGCYNAATIEEYIQNIVDCGLLHESDADEYISCTRLKFLLGKIKNNKREFVYSFRRRMNDIYIWVTFNITVPHNFSKDNPWVMFSWKEADNDSRTMEDATKMLSSIFHKILKINVTTDTHEDIKVYDEEKERAAEISEKMSQWFKNFLYAGNVYEEDIDSYTAFTNIDYLRNHFKESRDCIRCRYRRKISGVFRWVSMEIIPSIEYTDDNQVLMLYIRDINDDYVKQLKQQKELEYYCNNDTLTGIWNRFHYNNFCENYARNVNKHEMAVIFADINALKYMNDTFGHAKGDEYLISFSKAITESFGKNSCYRISGDEFVIILEYIEEAEFLRKAEEFYQYIQNQSIPMASLGYAWNNSPERVEELSNIAEAEMYKDKKKFHMMYPQYSRKNTTDE